MGQTYERHPSDLIHVGCALAVMTVGVLLATAGANELDGFDEHLVTFVTAAPFDVTRWFVEFAQAIALILPIAAFVVLLGLRRFRALLYTAGAGATAALLGHVVFTYVADEQPRNYVRQLQFDGLIGSYAFPNIVYFTAAVAALTALSPFVSRVWRRTLWSIVVIGLLIRILTATTLGPGLVFGLSLGWLVGSALLLAFGAPRWRPGERDIETAMRRAGVPMTSLEPAQPGSEAHAWIGHAADDRHVYIKIEGRDQRDADLLYRVWRFLRAKNLDDQHPFASVRRKVEHEALLSLAVARAGVRTPRFVAVAAVGPNDDAFLFARERIVGTSMSDVPFDRVTDGEVRSIWEQVAILHEHRIAHRQLRFGAIRIDEELRPWITDLDLAELAATDRMLATDVAQCLTASAMRLGVERAVALAHDAVGTERLAAALPLIQAEALAPSTRHLLRGHKNLVNDLQAEVQRVTGVDELHLEGLQRVRLRSVFMVLALGVAVYVLYPQLADLGATMQHVREANIGWVLAAVVFSGLTYVGAAMSMMACVVEPLPPWPTFLQQLASSFVNRITPASTGGFALNIRYMQRKGIDPAVGVTALGINSVGGAVIHIPLMILFLIWAGDSGTKAVKVPDVRVFVWIALGFALVSAVIFCIPKLRRLVFGRLIKAVREARHGLVEVARRPSKIILLLAGAFIVTFASVCALAASVAAYNGDITFVAIGAAFLTGSIVGHAAPTPGGLGGMEAALFAALTLAGLQNDIALSAVFTFRLATFWLPILPGWLAFHVLRARGDL